MAEIVEQVQEREAAEVSHTVVPLGGGPKCHP